MLDADGPRRLRERVGVLVTIGLILLAAAYFVLPQAGDGPDDVVLDPGAGQPVRVVADEPVAIWAYEFQTEPTCSVVDGVTGDEITLRKVASTRHRGAGSAGVWVTQWVFTPGSDQVEVTCKGGPVLLTPEPLPLWLVLGRAILALALGVLGLVLLAAAGSATFLRRRQARALQQPPPLPEDTAEYWGLDEDPDRQP